MPERNLLNHLLRSGITPSFSFPLDVAEFRGEGQVDHKRKVWPKMSTDLKQALSVYSPGKRLTVDGEDYEVKGLYIYGAEDPLNRAQIHFSDDTYKDHIQYYNRCTADRCGWVSKILDRPDEHEKCPVCDQNGTVKTGIWYRPDGFAPQIVPWNFDGPNTDVGYSRTMKANRPGRKRPESEPSGAVEFPAPLTDGTESDIRDYSISDVEETLDDDDLVILKGIFDRVTIRSTHDDGKGVELLLINSGYNSKGYFICELCGYIALRRDDPGFSSESRGHFRPYVANQGIKVPMSHDSRKKCIGEPFDIGGYDTVYLGMTFRTDVLMISLDGEPPFLQETRLANQRAFNNALTTLKEALITEIQKSAKLVNREINGGVRKRSKLNSDQNRINAFEIFLYDDVSGGAGLTSSILTSGGTPWGKFISILKSTETRLSGELCFDEVGCSKACLGCLFDFRNKREHPRFDRRNGLRIVRYILYNTVPSIESGSQNGDDEDLRMLADLLEENLRIIGSDVSVDTENGCILARKQGKEIHIRPRISYVDIFADPILKSWDENDIDFDENLPDVDASEIGYVQIDHEQILRNTAKIAEQIDAKFGSNRL